MGLEVLTASSTPNLIALATVRDRLIRDGTEQDELLGRLIAEASSAITAYYGQPFARQRYRESVCGNGRTALRLSRDPIDPDSVTVIVDAEAVTDFVVQDAKAGLLFRRIGWPRDTGVEDSPQNIVATYFAGVVLPDQIKPWSAALEVALGAWVRPTKPQSSPLLFECTSAGTTGADPEPTWATDAGDVVVDGSAAFTARRVVELPSWVVAIAYDEVRARYASEGPCADLQESSKCQLDSHREPGIA